tara:strand:- start:1027 stop:2265 length:1239 start_codon:yes stop_codon:yes gene_type:complete
MGGAGKFASLLGGGKGGGIAKLLAGYGGKFGAMPMLAKAPVTGGLTSYALAKLTGQKNPEKAALYGALSSLPFAYMKANSYANALDGKGGISAFDVLTKKGGADFMIPAGMENARMTGFSTPSVTNRVGGPGFPGETYTGGYGERFSTYAKSGAPTYKTMPGMGFEDLLRNDTARKGIMGNDILAGSMDLRAFGPLLAGYAGGMPDEKQKLEMMRKREKDRIKNMYEDMKNPYYDYVPEEYDFIPYADGGEVKGYANGGMGNIDEENINIEKIVQGPGYEGIEDLDIFEEASIDERRGISVDEMRGYLLDGYAGDINPSDIMKMDDDAIKEIYMEINAKYSAAGGDVSGPGGPKEDKIPAMLSDGEFVVTAKAVENLGNGDRYAGARKMYDMMNNLDPESETASETMEEKVT